MYEYKIKLVRVIDGDTPEEKRKKVVDELQLGELQVVFCHPQSAGHGLTMTKATSIIWCSPTYNAEHYLQFDFSCSYFLPKSRMPSLT